MPRCRTILLLAALCTALFSTPGCTPPAEPLRLGHIHWPGYEPLTLADDLGYFGNASVQVLHYSSGTQLKRAFRNRVVEVAAVSLLEAMDLARLDPDVRIMLALDYSSGADVILGQPGVSTMSHLRGHRIGYEFGGIGTYLLSRALEINGIPLREVQAVNVENDRQEELFHSGGIDAVVTFEPYRSRLLAEGATTLFSSNSIPNEILDVLVVREPVLRSHRDALVKVIHGWFRALDHIRTRPGESAQRLAAYLGLDAMEILSVYSGLRLAGPVENREILLGQNAAIVALTQHNVEILRQSGSLNWNLDARTLPATMPLVLALREPAK
jgi:NitT/TauT family transport system substrate-binding protein